MKTTTKRRADASKNGKSKHIANGKHPAPVSDGSNGKPARLKPEELGRMLDLQPGEYLRRVDEMELHKLRQALSDALWSALQVNTLMKKAATNIAKHPSGQRLSAADASELRMLIEAAAIIANQTWQQTSDAQKHLLKESSDFCKGDTYIVGWMAGFNPVALRADERRRDRYRPRFTT
jgi:hypothetical protein